MNKNKLTYLIIGSSISLVFLIIFQIYWVKTSVKSQQNRFDQTVMNALQEVVSKLEREEAITEVTSKILDLNELNSVKGIDSIFSFSPVEKSSLLSITPTNDTNTSNGTSLGDQLNIQFKRPQKTDSSVFIIRETKKRVLSSNVYFQGQNGDSLLKNQIKKKATLVNEIVNELAFISITNNFNDRINSKKIDSLLQTELKSHGVNTPFIFDIYDAETDGLSFQEDEDIIEELLRSEYRINLFENDFFIKSDSILLFFPEQNNYLLKNAWEVLLISFLLISILILFFYSSLKTIVDQKRLSRIKNDFINNMTHELKTPISTISLACEALKDNFIKIDEVRRDSYIGMIKEENNRLSLLVDNVLKSAVWDSNSLKLTFEKVEINPIIRKVASSFKIQLEKRECKLELKLNALNDIVDLDRIHFSNIIFNLLDNALKYSGPQSEITIETVNHNKQVYISVMDNGIGISIQNQKKVFDKFYRVSTGNIHDVKGFGLGLNYVKNMIDHFNGQIEIKSKEGKGTTVLIKLNNDE